MSVKDDKTCDGGRRDAGGEEVGDEDARGDEVCRAACVQISAMVGQNVAGNVGGNYGIATGARVRIRAFEKRKKGTGDG